MILLISPKNLYATKRLINEAKKSKIPLEVLSMEELRAKNFKINIKHYQTLYIRSPFVNGSPKYFPQIISLAKKFKRAGKKVVDAVIAKGELGEGKAKDYQRLLKAHLPIPKMVTLFDGRQKVLPKFVLKWQYGFKGQHVFFVHDKKQILKIAKKYPKGELLAQEFIKADYEYKVITVGYKSLSVVLRFEIDKKTARPDFKKYDVIPVHQFSTSSNSILRASPDANRDELRSDYRKVISLAERASKLLGRELAKVDILQKGKKFYILEVNRWPGLKSFEDLTGYNAAGEFVKYLK